MFSFVFFFNDTATTEIYTLSLHDALPICLPISETQIETAGLNWAPETCISAVTKTASTSVNEIGRAHV